MNRLKKRESSRGDYRIIKVEELRNRGHTRHVVVSLFEGNGLLDNEGLPLARTGEKCSFREVFDIWERDSKTRCDYQLLKLLLKTRRNHKNVFILSGDKISKNIPDTLFL